MRYTTFLFLFVFMLTACQEDIIVELDSTSQLMVDGLVTNQPGPHYVKLSLTTTDFAAEDTFVPAREAYVVITDSIDQTEVLTEVPDQPGVYQTSDLKGIVGRTYYLSVRYRYQDKEYQAQSTLLPVSNKFHITARYHENFGSLEDGYYVYLIHPRHSSSGDTLYNRIYVSENNNLLTGRASISPSLIYLSKGETGETGRRIHHVFQLGDSVKISIHSLNEEYFRFYKQLENYLDYESDVFSPPPVFPKGNVSNGAIGLFRASSVSHNKTMIEK